jgi:adenosylcobinamide-phosphate synthase
MIEVLYIFAIAVLLDRVFGEPPDRFHSTVWIGRLCEMLQKRLGNSYVSGFFLFVLVTTVPSLAALFLLLLSKNYYFTILLGAVILKLQFSWKGLADYTLPVLKALESGVEKARERLFFIVGRDASELGEEGILSATVESIGEGTNDGIIAPLFYYVILGSLFTIPIGIAAAVFSRAASTLDSMVGYKKVGYERIGFVSAKVDDLLNFIPSRITAILILFSALLLGEDFKNALLVFKRDRNNTISPNAGQPMAAMAGAIGVRLEKQGHHIIGDPKHELQKSDVKKAIMLSNLATVLFLFMSAIIILQ